MAGIYVLLDFHPYLENPLFVRTLKDIAQEYDKCARTIVLISFEMKLPQELEHLAARFTVRLPDKDERQTIVMRAAREWAKQQRRHAARRRQGRRKAGRQSRRAAAARRRAADAPGDFQRRRAHRRRPQAAARRRSTSC